MRKFRISPGTALGWIALFVAIGGTAYAATTVVNLADPTTPANVAHVDASGKVYVGDGAGPVTVDGTVSALQAPSTFFHSAVGVTSSTGCVPSGVPSGKALVARQVRVDPYDNPSPSYLDYLSVYANGSCSGIAIATLTPTTTEHVVLPFDPGVGSRTGLSFVANGDVDMAVYTDGYAVPTGAVPATGTTTAAKGAVKRP